MNPIAEWLNISAQAETELYLLERQWERGELSAAQYSRDATHCRVAMGLAFTEIVDFLAKCWRLS